MGTVFNQDLGDFILQTGVGCLSYMSYAQITPEMDLQKLPVGGCTRNQLPYNEQFKLICTLLEEFLESEEEVLSFHKDQGRSFWYAF